MLCGLLQYTRKFQPNRPNFLIAKMFDLKGLIAPVILFCMVYTNQVWVWRQNQHKYLWRKVQTGFRRLVYTFNSDTQQGLQNAVFFYVGKVCCLCGRQEQQELKILQLFRYTNPERYVYNEHGSKIGMEVLTS